MAKKNRRRAPKQLSDINYISIRPLDLALLIWNVREAAQDAEIGYEDADTSYEYFMANLNRAMPIKRQVLEAALWASNLLDEAGEFKHPGGYSFEQWLRKLLPPGVAFDRFYNLISVPSEVDSKGRPTSERAKNEQRKTTS